MKKLLPLILVLAAGALPTGAVWAQNQTTAPNSAAGLSLPSVALPPGSPASAPSSPASAVNASTPPALAFAQGVQAYQAGDFKLARENFLAAEAMVISFPLEFDLGNACYQLNDYGGAIVHYLRALTLDPGNPDARQNLNLARQAAAVTAPDPGMVERLSSWLRPNAWTWVAAGAGWMTLYLLFLPRLFRWYGALPWMLFAGALVLVATATVALWNLQRHARDGIVLLADTPLKISPTAGAQALGVLQPGEPAVFLEQHGDYYHVSTPGGRIGWVSSASFARIRE